MKLTRKLLPLLLSVFLAATVYAQRADQGLLTIDRIFESGEFMLQRFGPARWLADGNSYTTLESSATKGGTDIVEYSAESGERKILVEAKKLIPSGQSQPLDIEDYSWSADGSRLLVYTNSQKVWRQNTRGDYWVLDLKAGTLQKLGANAAPSTLMFAQFSPDSTRVAYVRENNLYVENLADHRIQQLTSDGSRTTINGTFDWVYEEELNLRDGFRWSPDGKHIAYWQLDTLGEPDFTLVDYTDSLYPTLKTFPYPKAGQTNAAARIGVVDSTGGATRWMKVPGDSRNHYLAAMGWAANSDELVIQQLNRLQNTDNVMLANQTSGEVHTVLSETDKAWVDVNPDDFHWLKGGSEFTWASERDGWRHVYLISRDGKSVKLITPGQFDCIGIEAVDEAGGYLYYSGSPKNATQSYLYRAPLDGSGRQEELTPVDDSGTNNYAIAPGARWAFHIYSSFGVPPVTDLINLPNHRTARVLADNKNVKAVVESLKKGPQEFFKVNADGVSLDGWMIKPPDFDSSKRYPVLFYVYGEPAAQTVLDQWAGITYLYHLMLAQQGYIVISIDNQGTPAPKGRDWRKVVYRQVGILASKQQAAAAREVGKWPFVDSSRIAVWGWSGGGSMTLNAIFRYPDIYKTAMAVAPVADMHYYDTIYQERYMGLPQEDVEGYKNGSPITFAGQLKGNLLVVHGTGDDNVHFQNTLALVNALVADNKTFTMMAYPNRTHSISEGPNTTRHLFELLTRYLNEHMPPGPVAN